MGLRPGGFAGLTHALGVRPLGTEAYHLSSLGSHLGGSPISGQYLHHGEGLEPCLSRSRKRFGPITECQSELSRVPSECGCRFLNTAVHVSYSCAH